MADSQINPKKIKAAERRTQALSLRKEGLTYREIADRMGVGLTRARQLVADGFRRLVKRHDEIGKGLLGVQLKRIEDMMESIWPKASEGHLLAIDRMDKLIARQANLLGQNAPKKVSATLKSGGPDLSELSMPELVAHCKRLGIPVKED